MLGELEPTHDTMLAVSWTYLSLCANPLNVGHPYSYYAMISTAYYAVKQEKILWLSIKAHTCRGDVARRLRVLAPCANQLGDPTAEHYASNQGNVPSRVPGPVLLRVP